MVADFHERAVPVAIKSGLLSHEAPLAAFVDTRAVGATIKSLHKAFPAHFEHMFAAKANTMRQALVLVRECGMGCEVASPGELEQALRAGFKPERIVFDEPAKTMAVLRRVLELGAALNIDNFQEFDRVEALLKELHSPSEIGFRINPQVGAGRIGAMSTATLSSKFGVALDDEGNREALIERYLRHPWLTTLHTHVGSQGCALELMAAGVRKVTDLALEINGRSGRKQVDVIDIGGGLPVNFESSEVTPAFSDYAAVLRSTVPELFSGEFRVKTEFGRSIMAKNGFMASRVEYTKVSGGRRIAITHAGAQVATRTVFMPEAWKLRVSVLGPAGLPKQAASEVQDIAGPLCFAGDMVATARDLPLIEPGDHVILHDTGGYYFSNPFMYNALPAPAVYGVDVADDGSTRFSRWRQVQTLDDMLAAIG